MSAKQFFKLFFILLFAILQGMTLGVMRVSEVIVTNPNFQTLTYRQFHLFFLAMIGGSILIGVKQGLVWHKKHAYTVFSIGILSNLLALLFTGLTNTVLGMEFPTIALLAAAFFFLGGGLGIVLSSLSYWIAEVLPTFQPSAFLFLFGGVSLGLALADTSLNFALFHHAWWLAPGLVFLGFFIVYSIMDFCPIQIAAREERDKNKIEIAGFLFLISSFVCGYIESVMSGWNRNFLAYTSSTDNFIFHFTAFWGISACARLVGCFLISSIPIRLCFFCIPLFFGLAAFLPFSQPLAAFFIAFLFPINLAYSRKISWQSLSCLTGYNCTSYLAGLGAGFASSFTLMESGMFFWLIIFSAAFLAIVHTSLMAIDLKRKV